MKFTKKIFLLAATFQLFLRGSLSNSIQEVLTVKVHCKPEITSKIECFLPRSLKPTDVVQIVSSIAYQTSGLSDEEVKASKELEINSEKMTDHMPFKLGHEFEKLEALWIIRSRLKSMTKQNFDEMLKLRALNLYENEISSLHFDVFHNLVNLEYLDLDNNFISELHPDLFVYMPDLTALRMRENKLEKLSEKIFRSNKNLEQIHLNGNKLKEIGVDFSAMENLMAVNLENNFMNCDISFGFYEDFGGDANYDVEEELRRFQEKVEDECRN